MFNDNLLGTTSNEEIDTTSMTTSLELSEFSLNFGKHTKNYCIHILNTASNKSTLLITTTTSTYIYTTPKKTILLITTSTVSVVVVSVIIVICLVVSSIIYVKKKHQLGGESKSYKLYHVLL